MSEKKLQYNLQKVSAALRDLACQKGINQGELGELIGVDKATMSQIMKCKRNVTNKHINKICEVSAGRYSYKDFIENKAATTNNNENGDNIGGGSGNTYTINKSDHEIHANNSKICSELIVVINRMADELAEVHNDMKTSGTYINHCLSYIDELKRERDELRKRLENGEKEN